MPEQLPRENEKIWRGIRLVIQFFVVVILLLFVSIYLYQLWKFGSYSGELNKILMEHVPATIGLPLASLAAACIVIVFEFQSGPIEVGGPQFSFKGASGQIILWILSFLSIVSAVKLLW
jgi:hypothetical protein